MTKFASEFAFPVSKFSYAGAGTPANRKLPERLSDIVNVKDWGALGDGTNDAPAIQAAINFCIAQGGGVVFFPPGQYKCLTGLVVGSDTSDTAFVQLIGGGGGGGGTGSMILGDTIVSGWLISKGTKTHDLIQRVEGLGIVTNGTSGGIKITGYGVQIRNCLFSGNHVSVDASQATGATIMDCSAPIQGDGTSPDSSGPVVFSSTGVGIYLGDNCMAANCRFTGSAWITYALSGTGASVIGCSTETTYTAVRVGWASDSDPAVIGGGRELAAIGCTVSGVQTERQTVTFDLYNAVGCFIVGNSITGGHGTANDQAITNMVYSGGTVTATTTASHNLPSGDSVLLLNVNDETEPPIAWRPNIFTTCHNATSNTFTYTAADPGYVFSGTISAMSWDPGTHVVTVTSSSTGANPIPVGTTVKLSNISGTWNPGAGSSVFTVPFNVTVTSTASNTTTFTYAGPSVAPSGDQVGNWDRSPGVGWAYPGLFGIRCRKVSETVFMGNQIITNSALAAVDLAYDVVPEPYNQNNAGEAVHSNNVFVGYPGERGWLPPTAENAAGWRFINCGVNGLRAGSNPSASVSPSGSLTFAYLPGQFSDPTNQWEGGPYIGQEYDISDGAKSGGGSAVWGDIVQGSGSGHYKVRYDGSHWIRIG